MTQTRTVEITVGLFVAAGLAALFFLAMQVSNLANFGGGDSPPQQRSHFRLYLFKAFQQVNEFGEHVWCGQDERECLQTLRKH